MTANHQVNWDQGKAYNGIDVSHWNGTPPRTVPEWVKFFGMKAAHIGGSKMVNGIDPTFDAYRKLAKNAGVRYRAFYLYVVPGVPFKEQVFKLAEAVGDLAVGECVEIDWEAVGSQLDYEGMLYLDALYHGRIMMYVNDMNPEMTGWMERNRDWGDFGLPLHHPDWSPNGVFAAAKWQATVWQTGGADVPGWARPIDANLVMNTARMEKVCGY